MPDAQRDANIERLFAKIDSIRETVTTTRNELAIVGTKIDDFSYRLKKLEDRDEKHLEKAESLELLIARIETIIEKGEATITDLDSRVELLEKEVQTLKNNWKWVVSLTGFIGSVIGGVVGSLINILTK